MNLNEIFFNVVETNSEAEEEVRKDGHTRDGQLQWHSHLDGEVILLGLLGTTLSDFVFALALYMNNHLHEIHFKERKNLQFGIPIGS